MKADFSAAGGSVARSNAGLNDLDGGTSAAKGWVATSGAPEPENRSCGPDSPPPDLLELVRSGSARSAASALGLSLGTTARLRAGYWPADPRRILQAWSDYRGRTGRIASSWFLRRVQAGGHLRHAGREWASAELSLRVGELVAVARTPGGLMVQTLELPAHRFPLDVRS